MQIMNKNKGWLIAGVILVLMIFSVYVSGGKNEEGAKEMLTGKHNVIMEIKDYGDIKVELDADIAPITVTNFINLVKEGFYNGLTFHRIIEGFMIQGGDPSKDGTGGSKEKIKGEFKENGYNNTLSHVRGVISMARSEKFDSASSQFFIVQEDSTYLDGKYAAFGKVTFGMEIVDQIAKELNSKEESGYVEEDKQPIITRMYISE